MIARVFPTKTSMLPCDPHVYFTAPELFTPFYDEVHISVTFSWDVAKGKSLAQMWQAFSKTEVKVGGVAIDGESDKPFTSGMYLKKGITITSRGCPNHCPHCNIKNPLKEFDDFPCGNIVQDNNILACSERHWQRVLSMLKTQRDIEFKGGMEPARITSKIVDDLRGLRIKSIWLACDYDSAIKPLEKAVELLHNGGFNKNKLYCYVLIGKEERRLRSVFEMGCMPFSQLYQEPLPQKYIYTKQTKHFNRTWSRPPAYKSEMKHLFNDENKRGT